jgi:dTDP-4-dehydrorhamnose 3,5-epimerase
MNDIIITKLKRINTIGGDVLHALKKNDSGFKYFGEAYFSCIDYNCIKAWKMHKKMTLNLIVPIGNVKFVFLGSKKNLLQIIEIGEKNYMRITVPPKTWFGFKGMSKNTNLVLNIADLEHDPNEVERANLESFNFKW